MIMNKEIENFIEKLAAYQAPTSPCYTDEELYRTEGYISAMEEISLEARNILFNIAHNNLQKTLNNEHISS